MLVACVSKVDLPMPGSPPTNSTEPRTNPPPVTRSSSVMPDGRRGASLLFPVSDSSANVRPLRRERTETGIEVAPVVSSSASVFHSPHESHLPCQRLYAAPQFWQTKERVDLAMKGVSRSLGGTGGTHSMKRAAPRDREVCKRLYRIRGIRWPHTSRCQPAARDRESSVAAGRREA